MKLKFKSKPEFFEKEKSGMKSNTARLVEDGDERKETLEKIMLEKNYTDYIVCIENSVTGERFLRVISDVTKFDFGRGVEIFIISW